MAPKRKSKKKGDILARMTVDQRRQYLERKAAQEQEKSRKREELLAGFLKLKLEDEQKKASVNEAKLNVKWRAILREAKNDSLKSELEQLKLWNEETVSSQDQIIGMLCSALQDASKQRKRASDNHLYFVRTMTRLHEEHVALLSQNFRDQEQRLIKGINENIDELASDHKALTMKLNAVTQSAADKTEVLEKTEIENYENAFARMKTKLEEEALAAIEDEEKLLQDAWSRLTSSLKEFEEETHDVRSECSTLQGKVAANLSTKEKLTNEIKGMKNEIVLWRERLSEEKENIMEEEERNADATLQELRDSLKNQQFFFRENIKQYNRVTSEVFKSLDNTIHLGEEILHLAHLCRRLETEEDRNLPYLPPVSSCLLNHLSPNENEEREKENLMTGVKEQVDTFSRLQPKLQPITESESGIGSSLTASYGLAVADKDGQIPGGRRGSSTDKLSTLDSIPTVTLDRIYAMLKDEELLKEVSKSSGKEDGISQPPSDFISKEVEKLLRTNESLSPFWHKLNNAQVQKLSLKKEAGDLQVENMKLKEDLRKHFMSLGLSDKGLTLPNAPLTITPVKMYEVLETSKRSDSTNA